MAGIELGRTFSPDIDIIENKNYKFGFYELYLIEITFGYWPYKIIRWWWTPYALITSHRSWASHGFIIGTLVRLGYFILPFTIILYILYNQFGLNLGIILGYWDYILFFILGWFLADCCHLILDYILPVRHWYENLLGPSYQWHKHD